MAYEKLMEKLVDIGAVKFGSFTLKSGMESPIYVDLRVLISYPKILGEVADAFIEAMAVAGLNYDCLAGIPYTALPIATIISFKINVPMIYARKEVKDYGTKKRIEGVFSAGQTCVVIDDLITTGDSKFETIEPFQAEGLNVHDVVVLLDREQGGRTKLEERGYRLISVLTISDLLAHLSQTKKIDDAMLLRVQEFLTQHRVA